MERDSAVNRSLGNGIAPQLAILGIAPRSLSAIELLDAGGPATDAVRHLVAVFDLPAHQEVGAQFVSHERLAIGIVKDGVALPGVPDVPVVMKKEAHLARIGGQVCHCDMAQEDSTVEI